MTGMRVCYKVLSVQLVQDMHVIPRCWDTNDFRREEGPAIPPSQVKTTLNQGKNNTVERQALPPLRSRRMNLLFSQLTVSLTGVRVVALPLPHAVAVFAFRRAIVTCF